MATLQGTRFTAAQTSMRSSRRIRQQYPGVIVTCPELVNKIESDNVLLVRLPNERG
jgi:hypothetical protein